MNGAGRCEASLILSHAPLALRTTLCLRDAPLRGAPQPWGCGPLQAHATAEVGENGPLAVWQSLPARFPALPLAWPPLASVAESASPPFIDYGAPVPPLAPSPAELGVLFEALSARDGQPVLASMMTLLDVLQVGMVRGWEG